MVNFKTGKITGTGAAINTYIGFKPKAILVFNTTDSEMFGVYIDEMADEDTPILGWKDVGGTQSAITSNGITILDENDSQYGMGFTIGTDADFNTENDVLFYIALG